MHKYNNQDHAMMTAILAARNIIAGERRYDPWQVNEDAEYGEEGVPAPRRRLKASAWCRAGRPEPMSAAPARRTGRGAKRCRFSRTPASSRFNPRLS